MGYTHYWRRRKTLPRAAFLDVVTDAKCVLAFLVSAFEVGVRGPSGRAPPILTSGRIAFNGDRDCGHERRRLGITWPADDAQGMALGHTRGSDRIGEPSPLLRQLQHVNAALGATVYSAGGAGRDASSDSDVAGQWFAGAELRSQTCGGDCSHETFALPQVFDTRGCEHEDGRYFDCCKTAYKPYDLAVQCVLVIAKHYLGAALVVSSDGGKQHWAEAQAICELVFGYGADFVLDE